MHLVRHMYFGGLGDGEEMGVAWCDANAQHYVSLTSVLWGGD